MSYIGLESAEPSELASAERVLRAIRTAALADARKRDEFRRRTAQRLMKEATARSAIFDPRGHLFGDPGWNILLAIYVVTGEHRAVSISDAANASQAPPTTGLRYLTSLVAAGLVDREPDWRDRRKSFVRLSERGTAMIEQFIDRLAVL